MTKQNDLTIIFGIKGKDRVEITRAPSYKKALDMIRADGVMKGDRYTYRTGSPFAGYERLLLAPVMTWGR